MLHYGSSTRTHLIFRTTNKLLVRRTIIRYFAPKHQTTRNVWEWPQVFDPPSKDMVGQKRCIRCVLISTDVLTHVPEPPCSLSAGEPDTWMAMQILALILELIDSHQSCWGRCITFPGSLKSLHPNFILFQIRHALLHDRLLLKSEALLQCRVLKQFDWNCDTSACILSARESFEKTWMWYEIMANSGTFFRSYTKKKKAWKRFGQRYLSYLCLTIGRDGPSASWTNQFNLQIAHRYQNVRSEWVALLWCGSG